MTPPPPAAKTIVLLPMKKATARIFTMNGFIFIGSPKDDNDIAVFILNNDIFVHYPHATYRPPTVIITIIIESSRQLATLVGY
jgi:hypothetical protein